MVQRYSPKIQVGTAKTIAKNLLTTKTGKKVSDTKLKEFMKKDKDLKKFAYSGKTSTITKSQAKKFFNKVVSGAKESGTFKVSRLAKKMGIKERSTSTTDIQMNKVYQHASTEEYNAQPHDTGPTPKELAREKRREKMMQTIHKRERAEEIDREARAEENKKDASSDQKQENRAAPQRATGGTTLSSQATGQSKQTTSPAPASTNTRSTTNTAPTDISRLAVFPVENQSTNVPQFKQLVEKMDAFILQHLTTANIFTLVPAAELAGKLRHHHMDSFPAAEDSDQRAQLAADVQAGLFISSTMAQLQNTITVSVELVNATTKQTFTLGKVAEQSEDLFELQRKLGWQITNALNAKNDDQASEERPAAPVTELPI